MFKQGSTEDEILSSMLLTNHNLYFLVNLMEKIRKAIESDRFLDYKNEFFNQYDEKQEK